MVSQDISFTRLMSDTSHASPVLALSPLCDRQRARSGLESCIVLGLYQMLIASLISVIIIHVQWE